ncbi:D-2-hydroxyacid dehydrogenase [Saccharopolyspora rhizosphaerae]|uniref:D-2-hydroxyacid dehydrogenase n=1 Tax=Saccharopolyspora rhizosphaerae TaxID=2492662 RepID=A0A3R8QGW4_9PSEU|nr:D-2-hydroxyacid dehydrogenase [Saccharopolyspora rhizosphaerae]RRO20745.1 D-2-hydroxyacid dehydrogenase [Saccharopolyspora rhizosphaerae]
MIHSRPTVVVLHDGDAPDEMARIADHADLRYATGEQLPQALPGADALFVWAFRSQAIADAWPHADKLRWIHAASAGVDRLLFPELRDSDVALTNSRGVFDQPIAEYVLGTVLTFAKDMHTTLRLQDAKQWKHRVTERLTGRTALVVGTGPIGRAIARQLTAAGLDVAGAGRTARTGDPDFGDIHASDDLARIAGDYDYLVVAAPLTPQTHGLINTDVLTAMRPTARLINVGRGEHVDQPALVEALRQHQIAGAALDVFDTEPLPTDSPLWEMPHVLISPHMSGDTVGWTDELVALFLRNLRAFTGGTDLHNLVDKHRGYPSS